MTVLPDIDPSLDAARRLLDGSGCRLAVVSAGRHFLGHRRGVADLFEMVTDGRGRLAEACVADIVVGKGAALLMIAGRVKAVYAATLSRPALELFRRFDIPVSYASLTDFIVNRAGTDRCPVEKLLDNVDDIATGLHLIVRFLETQNNR